MASNKSSARSNDRRGDIVMGMLPDLIGFNLRCAQLALFQHFGATVGQDGISVPQFGTLLLIEANPDISQSAIAEALRLDRSTLVQIIDRLENRGLVVRHISPTDRRSHALQLTDGVRNAGGTETTHRRTRRRRRLGTERRRTRAVHFTA